MNVGRYLRGEDLHVGTARIKYVPKEQHTTQLVAALERIIEASEEIPEDLEGYLEPLNEAIASAKVILNLTKEQTEFPLPTLVCGCEWCERQLQNERNNHD